MKINRSSWHWWLHKQLETKTYRRLVSGYKSITLCQYFWSTVFALIQAIGLCVLTLLGVLMLCIILLLVFNFLVVVFGALTGYFPSWVGQTQLGAAIGIGGITIILALSAGVSGFVDYYRGTIPFWPDYISKHFVKDAEESNNKTESGLIVSYYKAWKDKFCPIVELEEVE